MGRCSQSAYCMLTGRYSTLGEVTRGGGRRTKKDAQDRIATTVFNKGRRERAAVAAIAERVIPEGTDIRGLETDLLCQHFSCGINAVFTYARRHGYEEDRGGRWVRDVYPKPKTPIDPSLYSRLSSELQRSVDVMATLYP